MYGLSKERTDKRGSKRRNYAIKEFRNRFQNDYLQNKEKKCERDIAILK